MVVASKASLYMYKRFWWCNADIVVCNNENGNMIRKFELWQWQVMTLPGNVTRALQTWQGPDYVTRTLSWQNVFFTGWQKHTEREVILHRQGEIGIRMTWRRDWEYSTDMILRNADTNWQKNKHFFFWDNRNAIISCPNSFRHGKTTLPYTTW